MFPFVQQHDAALLLEFTLPCAAILAWISAPQPTFQNPMHRIMPSLHHLKHIPWNAINKQPVRRLYRSIRTEYGLRMFRRKHSRARRWMRPNGQFVLLAPKRDGEIVWDHAAGADLPDLHGWDGG